ncbi:Uncharacterised protein [Vibrio cholerae]|nr:Uncharacterised protein [Vibrio cholerae]
MKLATCAYRLMLGSILVKKPHYWAVAAAIKVVFHTWWC